MTFNDELNLLVVFSVALQVVSLIALPKWWKAAASPPLLLLVMMVLDLTNGGNLSGIITHDLLAPSAIGWLMVVLAAFGITRVVGERPAASDKPEGPDR